MSGLLPKTTETTAQGNFDNLTTQNLTVNGSAFMQAFTASSFSIGSLNVSSLTTPTIVGPTNVTGGVTSDSHPLVTTDTAQNISGVKTFTNAPVIGTITNTGTLTLPTSTGTLALVSQIPTNAQYVDLTTNQTVAGVKTFGTLNATTIGTTGIGTCDLEMTLTDANCSFDIKPINLIDGKIRLYQPNVTPGTTLGAQIVMNWGSARYFANAIDGDLNMRQEIPTNFINLGVTNIASQLSIGLTVVTVRVPLSVATLNNGADVTVPTSAGTLALVSQIPTNAQYVDLTTAQNVGGIKTFTTYSNWNGSQQTPIILSQPVLQPQQLIEWRSSGSNIDLDIGTREVGGSVAFINSQNSRDFVIQTNTVDRVRVPYSGISTNNTSDVLALDASKNFCTRTNIVTTDTTQTISGAKSFSSVTEFDEETNWALTGGANKSYFVRAIRTGLPAGATNQVLYSYILPTGSVITMSAHLSGTDGVGGMGQYQWDYIFTNNAGVVTVRNGVNQAKSESGGPYGNKVAFSTNIVGAVAQFRASNTAAFLITIGGAFNCSVYF